MRQGAGRRPFPWLALAVFGPIVLLLAVLGWGLARAGAERPQGAAPDFSLTLFDANQWQGRPEVTLAELRGRPVVLNFWASWCVECHLEAELLERAWQSYRAQGVVFLGVAYVDVEPKSLEYLRRYNITYPNGPDLRSLISGRYQVTAVPETFFIDAQGQVTYIHIGPLDEPVLAAAVERMLANG